MRQLVPTKWRWLRPHVRFYLWAIAAALSLSADVTWCMKGEKIEVLV